MINFEQLALLHRHGNDWEPLRPAQHPDPLDEDIERRILRGERLFRCESCDVQVFAVPPDPLTGR